MLSITSKFHQSSIHNNDFRQILTVVLYFLDFIERRNLYDKFYNVIFRDRSLQKYKTCYFDASNCKRETTLA